MDGQINLFDYLEATTEYKAEETGALTTGVNSQDSFEGTVEADNAKDQVSDCCKDELEVFIKNGFTILEKPYRFPDGLKTKWQHVELLILENGKFVTCSGTYKDMTFRRREHLKASLVGWKQKNGYE